MKKLLLVFAALIIFGLGISTADAQNRTRITGAKLDTSNSSHFNGTTTYDVIDFGTVVNRVRLCIAPVPPTSGRQSIYVRLANRTTTHYSGVTNVLTGDHMTAPVSNSDAFIRGETTETTSGDAAIPLTAPVSVASVTLAPDCTTYNWNTKGIVMHTPNGAATMDVTGWIEPPPRR